MDCVEKRENMIDFTPSPAMVEAVLDRQIDDGHVFSDGGEFGLGITSDNITATVRALIAYLSDSKNAEDSAAFAEAFMEPVHVSHNGGTVQLFGDSGDRERADSFDLYRVKGEL